MAKPTYIIMKDQPLPDKYGQYIYDADNMLAQSGLDTLDPADDLYSIVNLEHDVSDTFYTLMPFGDGNVKMEWYPLKANRPTCNDWFSFQTHSLKVWFLDGHNTVDDDFISYDAIANLVSNYNPFYAQYEDSDPESLMGDDGSTFTCQTWVDNAWPTGEVSGWKKSFDIPPNCDDCAWFSPYNLNCWQTVGDWGAGAVIGFDEENHWGFLATTEYPSWEEYLTDIFFNYMDYDGSNTKDYFYVITEIYVEAYFAPYGPYGQQTHGVYRYPKRMFLDAWDNGDSVTQESLYWRYYGRPGMTSEGWASLIAGNDGNCHNPVTEFGTTWSVQGSSTDEYYNNGWTNWSDADDGTPSQCSACNLQFNVPVRPALNLNVRGATVDIDAYPPYQPFYNMGGKNWEQIVSETHVVFGEDNEDNQ